MCMFPLWDLLVYPSSSIHFGGYYPSSYIIYPFSFLTCAYTTNNMKVVISLLVSNYCYPSGGVLSIIIIIIYHLSILVSNMSIHHKQHESCYLYVFIINSHSQFIVSIIIQWNPFSKYQSKSLTCATSVKKVNMLPYGSFYCYKFDEGSYGELALASIWRWSSSSDW